MARQVWIWAREHWYWELAPFVAALFQEFAIRTPPSDWEWGTVWSAATFAGIYQGLLVVALLLIGFIRAARRMPIPDTKLTLMNLSEVNGVWFIRAAVHNGGPDEATFYAKVEEVEGSDATGPEPPWWIVWRHGGGQRMQMIPVGSLEVLKIAETPAHQPSGYKPGWWPGFAVPVAQSDNEEVQRIATPLASDQLRLRIKVWHHESGVVVVDTWVALSLVDAGPNAVKVLVGFDSVDTGGHSVLRQ